MAGRPSNESRRAQREAQAAALLTHAQALGMEMSVAAAIAIMEAPGDPVGRLRLIRDAQVRRTLTKNTTAGGST